MKIPLIDLSHWRSPPRPARQPLDGRYVRLAPLDPRQHARDLFDAACAPGASERFRYLFETVPPDRAAFDQWLDAAAVTDDPLFFAAIDKTTNRALGRQALMRIDALHGVIEIGSILWGPGMARSRLATEALFLFADAVFALGYRRFEWKCNALNEPSRRAAIRFGFQFEGIFRQHMVVKGESRDTAWFAIIDQDWPRLKAGYLRWLRPENFDAAGQQLSKLVF
jgi:RimJ/RimL family protein N-acetyltransferase